MNPRNKQADFILTGTFVCDSPSTEFNIIFQGNPISLYPIVLNGTTYPQDCSCPVCAQNITIPTLSVPGTGLQGYGYDAVNQFSFLILNGSMCLNSVEVRLYYQPRLPVIARIFPGGGPTSGGTNVSISLDNFDPKYNYSCNIPAGTFPATKFSEENRVECTTPKPCSTGPGRVIFNVLMDTPRGQLSAGSQPWTIYADPVIKQISPSSALPGERIFITGNNLNSQPELSWLCRVDNLVSPFAISNGSYVLCEIPTTSRTGLEARVEVSLNGVDWSNSGKIYVASAVIPAHQPTKWYEMPKLLYIILGSIAGLLLLIILAFVAYRFTCGKKASESSQLLADEDIEPLLRGGPTEHNSYGPRTPSTRNELATIVSSFEKIDVSKLKLGKRIGKGSFGEVYAGHYLGTEVAVKKILTSKISPEFTQEFAREASLMRDLRHPNVVQFIGAALEEPDICIVTEYMSQGSLYHLLHDPKVLISWEMVRKIALDAARGMAYLHLRTPAIIHRDLKSHNLLVDSNWKVKVCDFGLSRIAVDLHKTMTACGTPCWTAPEILRNARYTTKADVFSYGIVLWELVTRDEPFAGMPAFQVIFAVGTKGVRLPLPTVCPPELIKLITSCWQEDPALRPPFSDIITYLERLNFAAPAPAAD